MASHGNGERARLLADAGIVRNRLKIDATIHNARRVLELRETHGSFAGWLDEHHPRSRDEWTRLFRKTFRLTGGEIVNEFLVSTGWLPGAHATDCRCTIASWRWSPRGHGRLRKAERRRAPSPRPPPARPRPWHPRAVAPHFHATGP